MIVIHGEALTCQVTIVPIVIVGELETFMPFVKTVPVLPPSPFLFIVSFSPFPARICVRAYIHTYVRANVPRVAFAMQNWPTRRSLIMHSTRRWCATIESPGRALRRARSSARVDFPRNIFAIHFFNFGVKPGKFNSQCFTLLNL